VQSRAWALILRHKAQKQNYSGLAAMILRELSGFASGPAVASS
jgi:hypothetical protein